MNVDFYRVETEGVDLSATLRAVSGLPVSGNRQRTKIVASVPFRMQRLTRHDARYWDGDITRIRMGDVPLIASLDGREEDVDLDKDEGMGECTAFRYDGRTRVLAIQATRAGVSASKWARYLEEIGGLAEASVIPVVVEEPDEGNRTIGRLEQVRKIHVRYAGALDPKILAAPTKARIADVANTAPVVEVTVGMGREEGSLPIKWAKEALRSLYQSAQGAIAADARVERIDIIGTFDDDAKADLDLLQFLIRETVEVAMDSRTRRREYVDRSNGIVEAWGRRRAQLERMFPR